MSVTTILFIAFALGMSLLSKYRKTMEVRSAEQEADVQADGAQFAEEESDRDAEPYFTYEAPSPAPAPAAPVRQARREHRPVQQVAEVEAPAQVRFDLRQAVIAQVILDNKYIEEINQ